MSIRTKCEIIFNTDNGQKWMLKNGRRELEAYVFIHGGWKSTPFSGGDPEPLIDYLKRRYAKERYEVC